MTILLVHGLGRTPVSMFGLASALRRAGHRTTFFGYAPAVESLPRIVLRLMAKLRSISRGGPVGLVGHSLGGLLLRLAIARLPDLPVHHLVFIGTPNQPPRLARWAWRMFPFRLLSRDCGRLLATPALFSDLPVPVCSHTIIAGTAGPCGRFSPFGSDANDAIVSVSETSILSTDSVVLAPAFHSFMMDHPHIRRLIVDRMNPTIRKVSGSPC